MFLVRFLVTHLPALLFAVCSSDTGDLGAGTLQSEVGVCAAPPEQLSLLAAARNSAGWHSSTALKSAQLCNLVNGMG